MTSYLDGRVWHFRLPVFHQPTGADAPVLKRLLLPQGELAQFHDSEEAMRYLALIELKAGGVRGNHFHRRKKEFIYVLSGALELAVAEVASSEAGSVLAGPRSPLVLSMAAGELAVIVPGIAHALRTKEPGQAIEFSPARFDATDTFRVELL
jgi:hypothetical protein